MSIKKTDKILPDKILFTILIVSLYIIGRKIPLCGVDTQAYRDLSPNAGNFIMQAIGGDAYQYSLFALGISPYIFSGLIIQFYAAYKKSILKVRISTKKMNKITMYLTLIIAVAQAYPMVQGLRLREEVSTFFLVRLVAGAQLVAAVALIIWWAGRNKKYGVGGQTVIIIINILDRIRATLLTNQWEDLMIPLAVSFFVMIVMLVLENAEFRIPLQRVSIHNIYSDKNYLAIKLNPVGVMPVMFAGALFLIPQMIIKGIFFIFPDSVTLLWWIDHMSLTYGIGIAVYLINLIVMTVLFALIMLSPGEMAEQFLQSGDSIVNLHAGRDTKRYLRRSIILLSMFSATVMGICIGVPLVLQLQGKIGGELVTLPTSVMMLTGLWSNIYREVKAVQCYDAYDTFL